jgi:hypothetical protein
MLNKAPLSDLRDADELHQLRSHVGAIEMQNAQLRAALVAQSSSQEAGKPVKSTRAASTATEQVISMHPSGFGRGFVTKAGSSGDGPGNSGRAAGADDNGAHGAAFTLRDASRKRPDGGTLGQESRDVQGNKEGAEGTGNYAAREQVISLEQKLAALRQKLSEKKKEVARAHGTLKSQGQRYAFRTCLCPCLL